MAIYFEENREKVGCSKVGYLRKGKLNGTRKVAERLCRGNTVSDTTDIMEQINS